MKSRQGIKWKNIFYFLSYAVEDLKYLKDSNVDYENIESTNDLLAVLLYKSFNTAYRNGFIKKYVQKEIVTDRPRGKINISKSIITGAYGKGKLVCKVYENNIDNIYNQIIKASINVLLSCNKNSNNKMNEKNKIEINKCMQLLIGVSNVNIGLNTINTLNNIPEWYKPVLAVCKLIIQDFIAKDNGGRRLLSINDENRLSYIYQHFLLNLLKKELKNCRVSAPSFKNGACRLDICVENKENDKVLILDAKWYNEITNEMSNIAQVNMYIDAYRDEKTKYTDVNGIVLFAHTTLDKILKQMPFSDNKTGIEKSIIARTLPVNIEFEDLKTKVVSIVNEFII